MKTIKRASIMVAMVGLIAAGCSSSGDSSSDDRTTTTKAASTSSTAASSAGGTSDGLLDGVPEPDGATKQRQDDIAGGGIHEYFTASDSSSALVSS
ncbi:MAG TPA: hypothetical protein VFF40_14275 [Acidimicrobiia bacterium]|nr:hypothetical protein [Acidimicrobiia bacterium]